MKVKVTQLCLTLWDPMDYTVHGILQARILEWVAFPFSRGSSQPRDQTQVSCIAGRFFTSCATREAQEYCSLYFSNSFCIGAGREHLIFIIWFREGPEALSHGMVSMETDLFIVAVVGEKGNI